MKRIFRCLAPALLLLVLVIACAPAAPQQVDPGVPMLTPIGDFQLVPSNTPSPTVVAPDHSNCLDTPSPIRVYQHLPGTLEIWSTTPEFTWFLSSGGITMDSVDDWDHLCVPEHYTLYLSSGPDFDDEIVIQMDDYSLVPDPTKLTMEQVLGTALAPATQYRWLMVGNAGDVVLDAWKLTKLHDDGWWYPQSSYYESIFRTGPECATGGIAQPQLLDLADDAVITTLEPSLSWEVSGCMPRYFLVEVSTTPAFTNPVWERNPADPGDYTKVKIAWGMGFHLVYMLRDCTRYYWRITGGIGPAGLGGDAEYGAHSEVRSFVVNTGACTSIPQSYSPTAVPEAVICSTYYFEKACTVHAECAWRQTTAGIQGTAPSWGCRGK